MDAKDENLRKLIEKLIDAKNAQMFLEDIEAGELILRKHPAPRPDDMLLANIKANIALHKLPQRTVSFRKRVFEVLAVAASIAIIAAISLPSIFQTPPLSSDDEITDRGAVFITPAWWDKEDLTKVVNDFENINAQFAQIETDNYDNDALALNEFQNQIEKVKDRLVSMESGTNVQIESYSNTSSTIEDLQNKLNELKGNNFWQDEYSNTFNEY